MRRMTRARRNACHEARLFGRGVCVVLIVAAVLGASRGWAADAAGRRFNDEKYRPQFHFTAEKGWLNDPNGLVYYGGEWHLFYQHNPAGNNWIAELSWGHAISGDLVHWRYLSEALPPTPRPDGRVAGSWSGSGFVDFNNSGGFQTGNEKPIVLAWTAIGMGQCLAYSNDRGRTFTKFAGNPVVAMDPPKTGDWDRDPRVFWYEPGKHWVMVFSISGKGMAFYSSTDLKKWTKHGLFTGLFECPELFEMPVEGSADTKKWIIWDAAGKYFIGRFDGKQFTKEAGPFILDRSRNYYAAQTWSNAPDGRRVLIAWLRDGKYPGMPFNQQMGIPSELKLRMLPEGLRLTKLPVKEVESLRYDTKEWKDYPLHRGNSPLGAISGDAFDIEAEIEPQDASQIVLRIRGAAIQYTPEMLRLMDSAATLRPVDGKIKLRVLVDRTSIEVFGNDGVCSISSTFLPPDQDKKLELYAEGGQAKIISLKVHRMKSAWQK